MASTVLQPLLQPMGQTISGLGLALIIGGVIALGAFTAPILFRQFDRPEAGAAMTLIFRRYDRVLLVATVLVLVGEGLQWAAVWCPSMVAGPVWLLAVRGVSLVGLVGLMAANLLVYNPRLEAAQKQGVALLAPADPAVMAFNQTHMLSEKLYKLAFALAAVLLLTMPWVSVVPLMTPPPDVMLHTGP
jgi:Domain of unknown function (DUF4149)